MGFFPNLDRAPREDQPRKTGAARFLELMGRDFWRFFRAGFLALVGAAPFLIGTAYAVYSHTLLLAPAAGLLGGALAGPELCGLADTVLRCLRDEPGFWWHTYRRAWKRNAGASLLPGALGGGLLAIQVFLLFHAGTLKLSPAVCGGLAAGMLLVTAVSLYLWPQLALMELGLPQLVKNSVLLFLGRFPQSLAALVITAAFWGLVIFFLPVAMPLLPLVNFWIFAVPALCLVYPGIEERFQIEEQLKERERGQRDKD